MKTTTFKLEGLRCESCARTIESVIAAEDGVREVDVSFATKEAKIVYDPEATDDDRLTRLIEQPSFRVAARSA